MWESARNMQEVFTWLSFVSLTNSMRALFASGSSAITGQNGVHLVREISPWSSQVLCIGLAQNLKPILSDDKYWNINPNISAFGM